MSDNAAFAGTSDRVSYTGQITPHFLRMLKRYGASPRLTHAVEGLVDEQSSFTELDVDVQDSSGLDWLRRRANRKMSVFLLKMGGADPSFLEDLPSERVRYRQLGALVLLAGPPASVAMFYMVRELGLAPLASAIVGLVFGVFVIILNQWLVTNVLEPKRAREGVVTLLLPSIALSAFWLMTSAILLLQIFEEQIKQLSRNQPGSHYPDLSERVDAFGQLLKQGNPWVLLLVAAVNIAFVLYGLLPIIVADRMQKGSHYYRYVVRLQERYATALKEVVEIRQMDQEMAQLRSMDAVQHYKAQYEAGPTLSPTRPKKSPAIEELQNTLLARVNEIEQRLEDDRQSTLAEVIELASRREAQ